jgi:predicted O-linked N-acetylglucosamine transferase (SPINDLY family)
MVKGFQSTINELENLVALLNDDKKIDSLYQSILAHRLWDQTRQALKSLTDKDEDQGCWRYFSLKCDTLVRYGEFSGALDSVDKALSRFDKKNTERLLVQKAAVLYHLQRYEEGLQFCEQAGRIAPNFLLIGIQKASILMALLRFTEAEPIFYGVLKQLPKDYQTNFNYASCLFENNKLEEAEKILIKLNKIQMGRPEPHRLLAKIKAKRDGKAFAIEYLKKVTEKIHNYLPLWEDLLAYMASQSSRDDFNTVLIAAEQYFPATNKLRLIESQFYNYLGFYEEAEQAVKIAISRVPSDPAGPLNLISIVLDKGDWKQAASMLQALKNMIPYDYRVHSLEAKFYERLHAYSRAETAWREALKFSPRDVQLAFRLASILTEIEKVDEAKAILKEIGLLRGETLGLIFNRLITNNKVADWIRFDEDFAVIKKDMTIESAALLSLFSMYALPELSPEFLKAVADETAKSHLAANRELGKTLNFPPDVKLTGKLRIGFGSMDFRKHALSYLFVNVFETIDKNRFELFAYSYGPDDNSDIRSRLINACDHFHDVQSLSDVAIAKQIAQDEIHIFVDLAGYTKWTRVGGICALRPAPILVHALGYTFTLGKGLVDYMISDQYVAPIKDAERFFSEKIAYVPCMYPTDPKILPGPPSTRSKHGLPQDAFIFCCFNQAYKMHPRLIDCWATILFSVPNSVLWIWENMPGVGENLKAEFSTRGIDPNLIIPAKGVPLEEHYARLQLADLALDTTPYGSGTTSVNALWCGVPLLGFYADTPSSRGSSSQLHAVGLPELVVEGDFNEYAKRAIHLATHPQELNALRSRLKENVSQGSVLFNPSIYTLALQDLFEQMWHRYEEGLPPDHLFANNV